MTDARTDFQFDALLRRLDIPAEPAAGFVSESLDGLLPIARRARARDRGFVGRLLRDLRADRRTPQGATPRLALVMTLLVLALLAALVVAYIGSERRLPPPFGLAANGTIAYVNDNHVFLASADGAEPRQVTFDGGRQVDPTFSRDGTRLAWREYPPGSSKRPIEIGDVVAADADGSNAIVIASQVTVLSHVAWSPDGRYLAFSGSIDGSPESGWIAPSDGSAPPKAFTTVAEAWDPVWSPDGSRLAIGTYPRGLLVMDRDGTHVRQVNHAAFREIGDRGAIAEWSPDGSQLAFTGIKGDPDANYSQEVYLVGLDGSEERLVSLGAQRARDASWSPDGSMLAYMHSGIGLGPEVVLSDSSGRMLRALPGYYGWYQPIWSPDGTKIVVTDDRPGPENLDGPAVRVILDVAGEAPPIVIPAAGVVPEDVPDWAASWQRLAP